MHDRVRLADQPSEGTLCRQHVLVGLLAAGRQPAQRGTDQQAQLIQVDRLGEVIERPRFQGRDRVFRASKRGDHRDLGPAAAVHLAHQIQTGAVRQPHIRQAQRIGAAGHQLARPRHRFGAVGVQPHPHQRQRQQVAQVGFVDDHEDGRRARRACARTRRRLDRGALDRIHVAGSVSMKSGCSTCCASGGPNRRQNPKRAGGCGHAP